MPRWAPWPAVFALAVIATGAAAWADHWQARQTREAHAAAMTGGSPARGRHAIYVRRCGGCHAIPGVPGARGAVGPPLQGWSGRAYIAGRLDNNPDNLKLWVQDPHRVDPQSAMPPTGVGPREAADIAAYLYTLR